MEEPSDNSDIAAESFYNSAGSYIDRISHIIENATTTKVLNDVATGALLRMLDQFQEWPQLLDPHLQRIVSQCSSLLADIHLSQIHPELSAPISRILYVLCKVRGRKVIVKFFRNDAQLLEPLVLSFAYCFDNTKIATALPCWEEQYIGLLWLAYMMSGAFALELAVDEQSLHLVPPSPDQELDRVTPKVAQALVYVSKYFLNSAGQQRNAAAVLLGQLVRRQDMQATGVHRLLIRWSIRVVNQEDFELPILSYSIVGHLAFWAQYVKAASGERNLVEQVAELWNLSMANLVADQDKLRLLTTQTCVLKVLRYMARRTAWPAQHAGWDDMIEEAIGAQFQELENPTTYVRYAAGKAVANVIAGLPKPHAAEAINFLFLNLGPGWTLWEDRAPQYDGVLYTESNAVVALDLLTSFTSIRHDLLHGSLLALAHVIMLRAVPAEHLGPTCQLALGALNYTQTSLAGTVIGENVRDAACWCVWALARKYAQTDQLWNSKRPFLQNLATELSQVACLDPVNNIRRAASAALQELIGRNPNKINFGLELSTVVDSPSVSAANSGMLITAPKVGRLLDEYWHAIMYWLTSWRGVAHHSIAVRRRAAQSIGMLAAQTTGKIDLVFLKLKSLYTLAEEHDHTSRHGIMMALSAMIQDIHYCFDDSIHLECPQEVRAGIDRSALLTPESAIAIPHGLPELVRRENGQVSTYKTNIDVRDSYCESACTLIRNLASINLNKASLPVENTEMTLEEIESMLEIVDEVFETPEERLRTLALYAATRLIELAIPPARQRLVSKYTQGMIGELPAIWAAVSELGLLGLTYCLFPMEAEKSGDAHAHQETVRQIIFDLSGKSDTRLRRAAVYAIRVGPLKAGHIDNRLFEVISKSLNDYTNDSKRGDVGWYVRLEAVQTATFALERSLLHGESRDWAIARICALAVESSDKMRSMVGAILARFWVMFGLSELQSNIDGLDTSSPEYFATFLRLSGQLAQGHEILHGYVTSAGSKAANTVSYASRIALRGFMYQSSTSSTRNPVIAMVPHLLDNKKLPWPARLSVPWIEMLEYCLSLVSRSPLSEIVQLEPKFLHNIFATTTRAHYQSHDLRLLDAAVGLYFEISTYAAVAAPSATSSHMREAFLKVRSDVLGKLCSMLGHKFAKTRNAVADALYLALEDDQMLTVDFSKPPSDTKEEVARLRRILERHK